MPLYEFHCVGCNKTFEKIAKEDTEIPCPTCNKPAQQIWSTPSPMVWGRGGRGF